MISKPSAPGQDNKLLIPDRLDACRALVHTVSPNDDVVVLGLGTGDIIQALRERLDRKKTIILVEPLKAPEAPPPCVKIFSGKSFVPLVLELARWAEKAEERLGKMVYLAHPAYADLFLEKEFPFEGEDAHPFWPWWQYFTPETRQNQPHLFGGAHRADQIANSLWKAFVTALPGVHTLYSTVSSKPPADESISVVIVTFNQPERLSALLASLCQYPAQSPLEVVVVKNGSDEETDRVIAEYEQTLNLVCVRPGENVGAVRGRNLGFEQCRHSTLIFLDDDVVIRAIGWDLILRKTLYAHPRIGATGAFGVTYCDDDSHSFLQRFFIPDMIVPVAWQSGFCVAVRRSALEAVGGWDEKTYGLIGSEDTGLGYALRAKGYFSVAAPIALEPDFLLHAIAHRDRQSPGEQQARQASGEAFSRLWGNQRRLTNAFK